MKEFKPLVFFSLGVIFISAVAATVNITASINDQNVGLTRSANKAITTTGNNFDYQVVAVATSDTEWIFNTDIGNAHYAFVRNTDTGNAVYVGIDTATYTIRLRPTDFALFPLDPGMTSLVMKATNAACEVEVFVREE